MGFLMRRAVPLSSINSVLLEDGFTRSFSMRRAFHLQIRADDVILCAISIQSSGMEELWYLS